VSNSILITGANRGIGLELVRQYADAEWRVYACCRQPESALPLNRIAAASAGRVSVHPLDVTKPAHIVAMQAVLGQTPLDILLNNAGIYGQGDADFGNTDVDRWLETFRINSIAPMKLMEALVENVASSERRIMATMSSKMGSMADNGSGGSYVYRSSKAAVNAVMKSASVDLKRRGITAVALHPGWVLTDMGGPNAEITTEQSVTQLRAILDRLTLADSGSFFDIDGSLIPW
jgi:NAD(P)-dependent dehydrogenase (short-subunit alcohol dehydrogenase family)